MKKLLVWIYKLFVFLSVIGGAISLYHYLTDGEDYALLFSIENQSQVIENNSGMKDLKILYNNIEIQKLYSTQVALTNTGKKAIAKDLIYSPIKIDIQASNELINVSSNSKIVAADNSFTININLLNPTENINFTVLTTEEPTFALNYKIREITSITQWNKLIDPPLNQKIYQVNVIWLILIIATFLTSIDAIFLVKEDRKLGSIFGMLNNIQHSKSFNKEEVLNKLSRLYSEYCDSLPFVFIDNETLISQMSEKIDKLDTNNRVDLYKLSSFGIALVRHGNLYSIRSINIIVGPISFLLCLGAVIFSILF